MSDKVQIARHRLYLAIQDVVPRNVDPKTLLLEIEGLIKQMIDAKLEHYGLLFRAHVKSDDGS